MITLTVESLLVESFPTTETAGGLEPQGEQALFAPITAPTDPCDVRCQEN